MIGPNADAPLTLLANYYGTPSEIITPYKSLQKLFGNKIQIDYIKGTDVVDKLKNGPSFSENSN